MIFENKYLMFGNFRLLVYKFLILSSSTAYFTGSSPDKFLPQVVCATFTGVVLGVAKEVSGGLALPIGLHIGNNTLCTLKVMGIV